MFGITRFKSLLLVSCASFAVENLMDFTDLAIAGNLCGEAGVGGVELYGCMTELLYFVGIIIANGSGNLFSEAAGRFDRQAMSKWFSNGVILSLIGGVFCALLSLVLRDPYLSFVGPGEATLSAARTYWNWYVLQALLQPFAVFLAALVYVDGDGRTCTAAFIAELLVNAGASYALCRWFGTTAGCAVGTAIGSLSSITVLSTHFLRRTNALVFKLGFSWTDSLRVVLSDWSESGCALYLVGINMIMSFTLVRWFGDRSLVVMAVVVSIYGFLLFLDGVPSAARPIICVYMGEKNYKAVRCVATRAFLTSWGLGALAGLALFVFPDAPALVFGIEDPVCLGDCRTVVRTVSMSCMFHGPVLFAISYLLYVGRMRLSLVLSLMAQTHFPVVGFLAGGALFGAVGFWSGYAFSGLAALVVFVLAHLVMRRGRELPYFLPTDRDGRLHNWDMRVTPDEASRVSREVGETLEREEASPSTRIRAGVLVEETLMSVCTLNHPAEVSAEVTLDTNEGIRIIIRDDGKPTASDGAGGGDALTVRSAVLKGVRLTLGRSRTMTAMGFNRREMSL